MPVGIINELPVISWTWPALAVAEALPGTYVETVTKFAPTTEVAAIPDTSTIDPAKVSSFPILVWMLTPVTSTSCLVPI